MTSYDEEITSNCQRAAILDPPSCISGFPQNLRWPNTVCARFTDSVSDAIKRALGLWYANTAVD